MTRAALLVSLSALLAACGGGAARSARSPRSPLPGPQPAAAPPTAERTEPLLPPAFAFATGLMPLRSTGVEQFRQAYATYDGRGVLIAILDSGLDAGTPGLITTSTGAPKVLDLRDFSGEGRIALAPVAAAADGTIAVGGQKLLGARRIARLATTDTWYAGLFRELPLGKPPAADVNGNGTNTDAFPLIVVRASDGWVVFIDSNLNGSFEDEVPLHDYRQGRRTIALGREPLTLAANFSEASGAPILDLFFDTSGHGTHVAAIAAGHNLFGIAGFHGVAPGAQLLGLKIANNARGGVSVHGSMVRAMEYAARFAAERGLPLVLNLSFGVGNEQEGRAVIDSLVDAFLARHPRVLFAVSAGNDGPGLSTLGFPGSADLALSVGALYPGVFARPPQVGQPPAPDGLASWSARGGEVAKPDIVAPGVAFSAVPRWDTGNEIKGGTSMAAPHGAGLGTLLLSALVQEGRQVTAVELAQALRVSARPLVTGNVLDQGAGVPQLEAAYRWLIAGHQGSSYVVRTADGSSAAFRRDGFRGPGDTLTLFRVRHAAGRRAARFLLRPDAAWIGAPPEVVAEPRETEIPVRYRVADLSAPGVYVGRVRALNPTDTLAGPLFTLVTTVVVPHDLAARPLYDERRAVGPGRTQRYFLRVPTPDRTLHVTVVLPDSGARRATVRLYEPNGQPFRGADELALGGEEGGTVEITVRAEDLVAGVYELDILAPLLAATTVTVRAELAPIAVRMLSGALELSNPGARVARVVGGTALVGGERRVAVTARGLPAETLVVRLPDWAAHAEVDVQMAPEQWNHFTDFGVTVFDSTGQQVRQGPLNYAFGRLRFEVPPELLGSPLVVELFPAYARADVSASWQAEVRVRFLSEPAQPPRSLGEATLVAGGRSRLALPDPPALALPEGFAPLVEVRFRPADGTGPDAVRRLPLETP